MPNDIYPDLTNSKYDVNYHQAKILISDTGRSFKSQIASEVPSVIGGGGGGGFPIPEIIETGSYKAPTWLESEGDMIAGQFTFQNNALIGATQLNYIIINKVIEYIDEDFTFNSTTGIITRNNAWQPGDIMVTPYQSQ